MKRVSIDYSQFRGMYILNKAVSYRPRKNKKAWAQVNVDYRAVKIEEGVITLKKGFSWNGLTNHRDDKPLLAASAFHDAVLPEIEKYKRDEYLDSLKPVSRKMKDQLFCEIGKIGYPWYKRLWVKLHYWPVRIWSIIKG